MRDKQADFDSVYTHLMSQGPCCVGTQPRYKQDDRTCAIAHLFPEHKYTTDALDSVDRDPFYMNLMALHDTVLILGGKEAFGEAMKVLATENALQFNH
jgi:hypothetical protein